MISVSHRADASRPVGAVCECDGKPISTIARMYINNDPNNPN